MKKGRLTEIIPLAVILIAAAMLQGCGHGSVTEYRLEVAYDESALVFDLWEMAIDFPDELNDFAGLDCTQVHDAYDADRDGVYLRISAQFTAECGRSLNVPGFAMKTAPDAPWQWRVRWSPDAPGPWSVRLHFQGRTSERRQPVEFEQVLSTRVKASVLEGVDGPLRPPREGENPFYMRRVKPDGGSEALWLFGACRAWVVQDEDEENPWYPNEWLDRETELLAPMRAAGYNLLNQWMAPWEFLIVHHDRAEFWRDADGGWQRMPLADGDVWSPYQSYDQGRAAAFDDLLTLCEGGPDEETIYLLFSPLPHQCLQVLEHPWGEHESGWSPENDGGRQTLERLNRFSGFLPDMDIWDFFNADPDAPLNDWRSQLFDHQANFYRYLFARWGWSRAVGIWVIVDELDAVGDEVGVMSRSRGWWAHPQCERWLADVVRLFRGDLVRGDGLRYQGDPYGRPTHAATTSFDGQIERGGNLDWDGGPPDARPCLFGWHWYPGFRGAFDWLEIWERNIEGIASYSKAPIGERARLVSEFGAPDRSRPDDEPSLLYPSLYHFAIWAAVFTGQAGTPMDWDDGKEFGELRPREREGIFDRESYPVDNTRRLVALRTFLADADPGMLHSTSMRDTVLQFVGETGVRVHALYSAEEVAPVIGWLFASGRNAAFSLRGLSPGRYRIVWYDPWTGAPLEGMEPESFTVDEDGAVHLDASEALEVMRENSAVFPLESRLARGKDAAFRIEAR